MRAGIGPCDPSVSGRIRAGCGPGAVCRRVRVYPDGLRRARRQRSAGRRDNQGMAPTTIPPTPEPDPDPLPPPVPLPEPSPEPPPTNPIPPVEPGLEVRTAASSFQLPAPGCPLSALPRSLVRGHILTSRHVIKQPCCSPPSCLPLTRSLRDGEQRRPSSRLPHVARTTGNGLAFSPFSCFQIAARRGLRAAGSSARTRSNA